MRPRSTVTARLQQSGQSSGHAVWTVDRPHEVGRRNFWTGHAQCTGVQGIFVATEVAMASFQDRVIGAMKLQASTFEEVEHDVDAISQAATVWSARPRSSRAHRPDLLRVQRSSLMTVVSAFIGWVVGSAVLWLVGTRVMPGKNTEADLGQMMRVVGFAQAPGHLRHPWHHSVPRIPDRARRGDLDDHRARDRASSRRSTTTTSSRRSSCA